MSKLLLLGLLMSFTAQAQLPPYGPDPINQVIQLTKENSRLWNENRQLRANVFSSDSILRLTRNDFDLLVEEKRGQVKKLETACNDSLKAEFGRRQTTAIALATLLAGVDDLEQQLGDEALTSRPLGLGRKPVLKRMRDYAIKLIAKIRQ